MMNKAEKLRYYIQGSYQKQDDIFPALKKYHYGRQLYKIGNNNSFAFKVCGIMLIHDTPIVIFPKNYHLSSSDGSPAAASIIRQEAACLIRVFHQYIQEYQPEWEKICLQTGSQSNTFGCSLEEVLYILDDFHKNGYLKRKHTIISQTRLGRILWNKTIHQTQPLHTHRQAIYTEPFMQSDIRIRNAMIQRIHRYLVCRFRYLWGWLNEDDFPASHIPDLPCSREEAIAVLRMELRQCYVQREVSVIQSMLRYLLQQRGKDKKEQPELLLTPDFHWIWEKVCGAVLGNVYTEIADDLLCKPRYQGKNHPAIQGQVPDILCIRKNKLYVLDAKYYDYHYTFPHWSDFTKQFFYFYTIKERLANLPDKLAHYRNLQAHANALLMPEYQLHESEIQRYLGILDLPWNPSLGTIQVWLLNAKKIFSAYLNPAERSAIQKSFFDEIDQKSYTV